MSSSMVLILLVFIIFAWAWYSASKLQNQIHCTYHRVDKTVIERFTKRNSKYVVFDGAQYDIVPDRISLIRWKRGIHQFLPIWVQHLDYYWDNKFPKDPSTYQTTIMSPEVKNVINQEARMHAFAKGVQTQGAGIKKVSGIVQYLPYIAIGLGVIAVFWVYTISRHINVIEQAIKLIPK